MPAASLARLKESLRDHGVSFDVVEHARSDSATAEALAGNRPAEQAAETVVLRTPGGYRLAVVCGSDRLDLHKAAEAFGIGRHQLRFASEADMARSFPVYEVGAIPPIGPDTPAELIDLRLLDYGLVLCPAGDHEHSLWSIRSTSSASRERGRWICARTNRLRSDRASGRVSRAW